MEMKLTSNMASIVQKVTRCTPECIVNMSIEELEKHEKVVRKQNRLFYKLGSLPLVVKRHKKNKFSSITPRGSMIAAHYRFLYREDTNKKIMKIR